ncbi:MAG: purine-nucleoside phosphorylase [Candidatus Krumholzibacteriota bacterium]|nr:purine-nucleoside phosphorylase [Candidatus Krumholzibacteriota bacterium]
MAELYDRVRESADFLLARGAPRPAAAVVLGSGLGDLADRVDSPLAVPYHEVPHFARSTVDFHEGQLVFGRLGSLPVAVMEGRLHYYEGHSMEAVVHPLRSLALMGAKTLVVTSAVGGVNPAYGKGDVVMIRDHINLMGDNPLIGPNDDRLGPRFPDMSEPYRAAYRQIVAGVAAARKLACHEGVLAAVAGPNLETAAEYRFLRDAGADVVGMSMVPENLAAVHMGLSVLGLAVVTDLCDPDHLEPVDVPEILRVAAEAGPRLQDLVLGFLSQLEQREGVEA